jgi:predicted amino acid-binding ACT domain protein
MEKRKTKYIVQYRGFDFPGIIHAATSLLFSKSLTISNISHASEGNRYTVFIICQPEINAEDADLPGRTASIIKDELEKKLNELSKTYIISQNKRDIDIKPEVTVNPYMEEGIYYKFFLKMDINIGNGGLVAGVTSFLRHFFNVDEFFLISSPSRKVLSSTTNEEGLCTIYIKLSRKIFDHSSIPHEDLDKSKPYVEIEDKIISGFLKEVDTLDECVNNFYKEGVDKGNQSSEIERQFRVVFENIYLTLFTKIRLVRPGRQLGNKTIEPQNLLSNSQIDIDPETLLEFYFDGELSKGFKINLNPEVKYANLDGDSAKFLG